MAAIFLCIQIVLNGFVTVLPDIIHWDLETEDTTYMTFITTQTNLLDMDDTGQTLIDDMYNNIARINLYNDSIIFSFLGGFKIFIELILFVIQLAIQMLLTPTIFMNIILYNFIGSSVFLYAISLVVNIWFYGNLTWILLKGKTGR